MYENKQTNKQRKTQTSHTATIYKSIDKEASYKRAIFGYAEL